MIVKLPCTDRNIISALNMCAIADLVGRINHIIHYACKYMEQTNRALLIKLWGRSLWLESQCAFHYSAAFVYNVCVVGVRETS